MRHAFLTCPVLLLAGALLAGCSTAGQPVASAPAASGEPAGYLAPAALPRVVDVLPQAPQAGSARYEADRRIFRDTRRLEGTPRWALATGDVEGGTPAMLRHFSCAVGVPLDAAKLPRLAGLLERAGEDADRATAPAKRANHRLRPFQIDDGAVCQPKDKLAHSFDYPSGHATWGWTVGLILAELAPDRATDVALRARAFADSRVVCGAHNFSAIEAGAMNAATIVATLHGEPAFERDVESARDELAAYRRSAPPMDGAKCAAEKALIVRAPY
ncbi:phosphatase PAP2 family protein [Frateuria sp. Soil773]|uniref:acid phosphatase n=1 Tax=Frateuria sp. Soil773 TaxID=1736407 RepID=UPI0009EB6047|nr:phosphatase PAP2 family protein [Frateuria sp. Soil773]